MMPPGSKFLLDHRQKLLLAEPSLAQAIDETGEARDRRRHEPAGHRTRHASRRAGAPGGLGRVSSLPFPASTRTTSTVVGVSVDALWQLALADAGLSVDPLRLDFSGPPPPDADWARHFPPGSRAGAFSPYGYAEQQAVDAAATLHRHRILIYIHPDKRVVLAMMRHELEHVSQADASLPVYEAAEVLRDSLTPIYAPLNLAGSAAIYNALPNERDANRVSAILVCEHYGESPDSLRFGDHGSLFREPPPESGASLGRRLLAFASLHPGPFENEVARRARDLDRTLDDLDRGGAKVWPRLLAD